MNSSDDQSISEGQHVRYDEDVGAFVGTDAPVVPYVPGSGVGPAVVSATRRVLGAAAEEMGRTIHWEEYPSGDADAGTGGDLPAQTVTALEQCRIGLVGPRSANPGPTFSRATRRRLGVDATATTLSGLDWTPSPSAAGSRLDAVCFSDTTEDSAAGLEFASRSATGRRLRDALESELDAAGIKDGPAGFGVRPTTEAGTERVVSRAIEYALEHDRDRLTVVHQGDRLPGTEGRFRDWAVAVLTDEYDDATVTEAALHEAGGEYPEDEVVVVDTRTTDEVCRALVTDPGELDVLVAPASAGEHVATVGSEVAGGAGVTPTATVGDGHVFASPQHGSAPDGADPDEANPIATIRAACLLFDALGWEDVPGVARDAVDATLADGVVTPDLAEWMERAESVSTTAFADRVVEHVRTRPDEDVSGGVETTPEERAAIKENIAGLYNAVFEDQIRAADVQLNQLRGDDEEADVYLPTVGINFRYWREWPVERRLEVLLHEFAHVENYDDDHSPAFYDRLVELTAIAEEWQSELAALFDQDIDFEAVEHHVVESVHEETIDSDADTIPERKRALREAFGLSPADYE